MPPEKILDTAAVVVGLLGLGALTLGLALGRLRPRNAPPVRAPSRYWPAIHARDRLRAAKYLSVPGLLAAGLGALWLLL